jgi:hypothetical protein
MSDWNKITTDKVSREHRERVLSEARKLLSGDKRSSRRQWFWGSFGLAFGAAAAVVLTFRLRSTNDNSKPDDQELLAASLLDPDLLANFELLEELELLENLEELEQWEES